MFVHNYWLQFHPAIIFKAANHFSSLPSLSLLIYMCSLSFKYEQTITHDTRIQPKDPPFLLHATKPYQELIPTDMDKSYASLVKDTRRTDDMSSCSKSGELLTAPNPKKNASLSTSESDPAAAVAAILMAGSAVRHTPHLPVQEKTKYDKPPNDVNALFAQFEKKRYTYIPKELVK